MIEEHCRQLGLEVSGKDILPLEGEYSQRLIAQKLGVSVPEGKKIDDAIPVRPPVMCAGCPHRGMFYTLHKNKVTVHGRHRLLYAGRRGAAERHRCDGCAWALSITAHPRLQQGAGRGGGTQARPWPIIGDSTFMHSGMTGLANIAYNQSAILR